MKTSSERAALICPELGIATVVDPFEMKTPGGISKTRASIPEADFARRRLTGPWIDAG